MSEQVSVEEVGRAEDVLQRMIGERRALEHAQMVLRTFREVQSALLPAQEELEKVKGEVEKMKGELAFVEGEYLSKTEKAEASLSEYMGTRVAQVETAIAVVVKECEERESVRRGIERDIELMRAEFDRDVKEQERILAVEKGELEKVRVEHGVLVEAMNRAAVQLGRV